MAPRHVDDRSRLAVLRRGNRPKRTHWPPIGGERRDAGALQVGQLRRRGVVDGQRPRGARGVLPHRRVVQRAADVRRRVATFTAQAAAADEKRYVTGLLQYVRWKIDAVDVASASFTLSGVARRRGT